MPPHARPLGQPVAALGQGQVVRLPQQPQQRRLHLARDPRLRAAAHPLGGPPSFRARLRRPAVGGPAAARNPPRRASRPPPPSPGPARAGPPNTIQPSTPPPLHM